MEFGPILLRAVQRSDSDPHFPRQPQSGGPIESPRTIPPIKAITLSSHSSPQTNTSLSTFSKTLPGNVWNSYPNSPEKFLPPKTPSFPVSVDIICPAKLYDNLPGSRKGMMMQSNPHELHREGAESGSAVEIPNNCDATGSASSAGTPTISVISGGSSACSTKSYSRSQPANGSNIRNNYDNIDNIVRCLNHRAVNVPVTSTSPTVNNSCNSSSRTCALTCPNDRPQSAVLFRSSASSNGDNTLYSSNNNPLRTSGRIYRKAHESAPGRILCGGGGGVLQNGAPNSNVSNGPGICENSNCDLNTSVVHAALKFEGPDVGVSSGIAHAGSGFSPFHSGTVNGVHRANPRGLSLVSWMQEQGVVMDTVNENEYPASPPATSSSSFVTPRSLSGVSVIPNTLEAGFGSPQSISNATIFSHVSTASYGHDACMTSSCVTRTSIHRHSSSISHGSSTGSFCSHGSSRPVSSSSSGNSSASSSLDLYENQLLACHSCNRLGAPQHQFCGGVPRTPGPSSGYLARRTSSLRLTRNLPGAAQSAIRSLQNPHNDGSQCCQQCSYPPPAGNCEDLSSPHSCDGSNTCEGTSDIIRRHSTAGVTPVSASSRIAGGEVSSRGGAGGGYSGAERVVVELLETEWSYVCDLKDIVEGYRSYVLDRLDMLGMVPEELSELFGNVQDIFVLNSQFYIALDNCNVDVNSVAECFLSFAPCFTSYQDYCTSYPRMVELWDELLQFQPIKAMMENRQLELGHRLPLSAYLLKPVQRILKYHLFLENMLKHCRDSRRNSRIEQGTIDETEIHESPIYDDLVMNKQIKSDLSRSSDQSNSIDQIDYQITPRTCSLKEVGKIDFNESNRYVGKATEINLDKSGHDDRVLCGTDLADTPKLTKFPDKISSCDNNAAELNSNNSQSNHFISSSNQKSTASDNSNPSLKLTNQQTGGGVDLPLMERALDRMTGIAWRINEAKRRQELLGRVAEIQHALLEGGDQKILDTAQCGDLVLEGRLRYLGGAGKPSSAPLYRQVILFTRVLVVAKERSPTDGALQCKQLIPCSELMLNESFCAEPLAFQCWSFQEPRKVHTFLAKNADEKRDWTRELKIWMLEAFGMDVPERARSIIMSIDASTPRENSPGNHKSSKKNLILPPKYLEKRRKSTDTPRDKGLARQSPRKYLRSVSSSELGEHRNSVELPITRKKQREKRLEYFFNHRRTSADNRCSGVPAATPQSAHPGVKSQSASRLSRWSHRNLLSDEKSRTCAENESDIRRLKSEPEVNEGNIYDRSCSSVMRLNGIKSPRESRLAPIPANGPPLVNCDQSMKTCNCPEGHNLRTEQKFERNCRPASARKFDQRAFTQPTHRDHAYTVNDSHATHFASPDRMKLMSRSLDPSTLSNFISTNQNESDSNFYQNWTNRNEESVNLAFSTNKTGQSLSIYDDLSCFAKDKLANRGGELANAGRAGFASTPVSARLLNEPKLAYDSNSSVPQVPPPPLPSSPAFSGRKRECPTYEEIPDIYPITTTANFSDKISKISPKSPKDAKSPTSWLHQSEFLKDQLASATTGTAAHRFSLSSRNANSMPPAYNVANDERHRECSMNRISLNGKSEPTRLVKPIRRHIKLGLTKSMTLPGSQSVDVCIDDDDDDDDNDDDDDDDDDGRFSDHIFVNRNEIAELNQKRSSVDESTSYSAIWDEIRTFASTNAKDSNADGETMKADSSLEGGDKWGQKENGGSRLDEKGNGELELNKSHITNQPTRCSPRRFPLNNEKCDSRQPVTSCDRSATIDSQSSSTSSDSGAGSGVCRPGVNPNSCTIDSSGPALTGWKAVRCTCDQTDVVRESQHSSNAISSHGVAPIDVGCPRKAGGTTAPNIGAPFRQSLRSRAEIVRDAMDRLSSLVHSATPPTSSEGAGDCMLSPNKVQPGSSKGRTKSEQRRSSNHDHHSKHKEHPSRDHDMVVLKGAIGKLHDSATSSSEAVIHDCWSERCNSETVVGVLTRSRPPRPRKAKGLVRRPASVGAMKSSKLDNRHHRSRDRNTYQVPGAASSCGGSASGEEIYEKLVDHDLERRFGDECDSAIFSDEEFDWLMGQSVGCGIVPPPSSSNPKNLHDSESKEISQSKQSDLKLYYFSNDEESAANGSTGGVSNAAESDRHDSEKQPNSSFPHQCEVNDCAKASPSSVAMTSEGTSPLVTKFPVIDCCDQTPPTSPSYVANRIYDLQTGSIAQRRRLAELKIPAVASLANQDRRNVPCLSLIGGSLEDRLFGIEPVTDRVRRLEISGMNVHSSSLALADPSDTAGRMIGDCDTLLVGCSTLDSGEECVVSHEEVARYQNLDEISSAIHTVESNNQGTSIYPEISTVNPSLFSVTNSLCSKFVANCFTNTNAFQFPTPLQRDIQEARMFSRIRNPRDSLVFGEGVGSSPGEIKMVSPNSHGNVDIGDAIQESSVAESVVYDQPAKLIGSKS